MPSHAQSDRSAFSCFMGCFLGALLAFTSGASAAEPAPLRLIQTVPLPHLKGGFDLMAADVAGKRLFLAAEDNNTLEVIDLAAGVHRHSIGGMAEPKWVVYRPESQRLYVSNGGDGSVRVLDSRTFECIKRFGFRKKANNLRYDAAKKQLFVGVGKTYGAIGIIDAAHDVIVGEIPLANYPKQFELDGDRLYVNVPQANHIAVLDRTRMTPVETWPVSEARDNVPMGSDAAHHRLFIGCEPGKLVVFDTTVGKSVAHIEINTASDGISYDAARKRIYVSCAAGSIDAIEQLDADHYKFAARIPTAPGAGTSLFISELKCLCLAVPQKDTQQAELRLYEVGD